LNKKLSGNIEAFEMNYLKSVKIPCMHRATNEEVFENVDQNEQYLAESSLAN